MPKYGIFDPGQNAPFITFEGDSFLQHGDLLKIMSGKGDDIRVVAALRLEAGQTIQELSSSG